ncbi:MAG: TonB-dependent receptor, partial [Lysobacterales bacterium]
DKRFWYNWGDLIRRFDNRFTSLTVDTGDENLAITEPTYGTIVAHEFAGATGSRIEPLANGLYRRIPRMSHINVGGLNVEWGHDAWTVAGDIGYAHQKTERTLERLRTRLDRSLERFADGVSGSYDIHTYDYPVALLYDSFGEEVDPNDTSHQYVEQLRRTLTWEEAEDISFRLDFGRELGGGFLDEVLFGLAWNDMQFTRDQVQKQHADPGVFDIDTLGSVRATGILPGVNAPGFKHSFAVYDINDPQFEEWLENVDGYYAQQSGQFDVTEENTALYLQANFSGGQRLPYRGNFGVRYVDTRQGNLGWVGEGEGDDFVPADPDNPLVETSRSYDYFLPSFNLAFDLAADKVLRFAANKALTRPDPIDMSSRIEIDDLEDAEERTGEGGNPDLEPYTTISVDASLEWYPGSGGFYAIGLFYKDLESYIASGSSTEPVPVTNDEGVIEYLEYEIARPVNTDGGRILGAELQWHLPFDSFTEGFWSYFGINGSYTYVDAEMDAVVPDRGTRISLRGTSEKSGNLVVYFERARFGARLAANYRSDYLFQEAEDSDRFDEWTRGRTIVDLNFDYLVTDNIKLRFSALNLTGENRARFWYTPGAYFSDERDNGQEYVLEIRYASN